jgi:hypothetical protein
MILPYLAIASLVLVTAYSTLVSFRQRPEIEEPGWIFPDGGKRSARIFAGVATLVFVIVCAGWFGMIARKTNTRSLRFLIPEGYNGWIRVEFDVPGEAPLRTEGGQIVLKIPSTGLLRTSSPEQFGWARDAYEFYSAGGVRPVPDSGTGQLIWGKLNGEESGSSGKRKYEELFVGTEQQYHEQRKAGTPRGTSE